MDEFGKWTENNCVCLHDVHSYVNLKLKWIFHLLLVYFDFYAGHDRDHVIRHDFAIRHDSVIHHDSDYVRDLLSNVDSMILSRFYSLKLYQNF